MKQLFSRPAAVATDDATDVVGLLKLADELSEADALEEALDRLAVANRQSRDPRLEARLIDLRAEAARRLGADSGLEVWPPEYADPFPEMENRIPEVAFSELTAEVLGGSVAHHGALIVRDVLDRPRVAQAIETIDRAQEQARLTAGEPDPRWYRPLSTSRSKDRVLRQIVNDQGGTWLADSPRASALILDQLWDTGVIDTIAEHFGERPVFSLQKSTLRRSLPEYNLVAWHQDGSFLDSDVRTMNIWIALTDCGGDLPTPALEVVPRRIDTILPVDGVMSPHSVSYDLVAELAQTSPTVVPQFAPGDAILFDQHFLHRTHLTETVSDVRYALECWLFAPSHQSPNYLPLLA